MDGKELGRKCEEEEKLIEEGEEEAKKGEEAVKRASREQNKFVDGVKCEVNALAL
jgi:hypothetical protein